MIAIIGVLVALIMPAVQAARESANRAKCRTTSSSSAWPPRNITTRSTASPPAGTATAPVYDSNGNLIGGDHELR